MKKLLFLLFVALATCLRADRTANQAWVAGNFAPSNLVTRVKALEDAPSPTESDPAFTLWKTNASVAVGADSHATGASSVAVGKGAKGDAGTAIAIGDCAHANQTGGIVIGAAAYADGEKGVAIGESARSGGDGAVQIGEGVNNAANTLQFRSYPLVDAGGRIPSERIGDSLEKYIPRNGTNGVVLADMSKWYVGDTDNAFLAIGYKFQGHPTIPDVREEWWACSPYAWNFSYNTLRVSIEGVDFASSVLLKKDYEMSNYLDTTYETLDQRIARLADTGSCVKFVPYAEYEGLAYALTKGVVVLNSAKTDTVAELRENMIRNRYMVCGDEGLYLGEDGDMFLSPGGPSISLDSGSHYLDFPTGKNGTFALTSDINAASVLAAVKAMTDAQKAELKTALGL